MELGTWDFADLKSTESHIHRPNFEFLAMLYPLTFHPIFKERVWGGRHLEGLYQKRLPASRPIGESWEITDRPEDVSVIAQGPLAGKDLRWLMEHEALALLGTTPALNGRFPLLVKILDAQETLSLQVHPPASVAAQLGGEPKAEMWYIAATAPGAELFVGFKRGVTRAEFERKINEQTVADCVHRHTVRPGDAMFLPSGRIHAIGAGNVIFEIQQNADTTYRVFDWNRLGLDDQPRQLHVAQSLACIDFEDFEPPLIRGKFTGGAAVQVRALVRDPLFTVDVCRAAPGEVAPAGRAGVLRIIGMLGGRLVVRHRELEITLAAGEFCLLPASLEQVTLRAETHVQFLRVQPGNSGLEFEL